MNLTITSCAISLSLILACGAAVSADGPVEAGKAATPGALTGRMVLATDVSPEATRGGGAVPIADGMPAQLVSDDAGRPGVQYPGTVGRAMWVLVATPEGSLPGAVASPPSTGYTYVGTASRSAPFPRVPGVRFTAPRYTVFAYQVRAGGQVFWESLPPGSIVWVAPA